MAAYIYACIDPSQLIVNKGWSVTIISVCIQAVDRLQAGLPAVLLRLQPPVGHGLLQVRVRSEWPPPADDDDGHGGAAPLHGILRRPVPLRSAEQKTTKGENHVHTRSTGRVGVFVSEDEISRYFHARGGCS